ncbi:MAG: hypothetical protein COV30_01355 [Candidatus Yanofskybacteria bacterium CG10_big_fil_rev_8_21_14_0_10_37_15]|uniref:Glycosyl transferase family 1 n=1 Tax=Candidatus Yanofskybacteria bacterium CG10_big_fil_rev_8_21_14_0_10_37_15 TaxID=1975097 RepID=A0A2H0R5M1_9BACT|nr:MAG: hypothetical protein COV30_01355 [Candidatus Yanofskybacteria bacterium CG10_big_fil_rev_8_21_14_0_10_37_15]
MKIIYLAPSLDPHDGYSRYSLDVISRMALLQEVVVICHKKSNCLPSVKEYEALRPAHHYFSNPLVLILDIFKLRKILKEEIKDENTILHFIAEGYAMFLPFLAGLKFKSVMTIHGTYSVLPLKNWKTAWLYKQVYKKLDRVIAVSNFTKKHLLKHVGYFIPENKVRVMTNGVDFIEHPLLDKKNDKICTIISAGEVKNRKGAHHLVRVAKILKDKFNLNFMVYIVGKFDENSGYFKNLRKYIDGNNLDGKIKFTGQVLQEELNEYYKKANIFALLSVNENFHYEGYPLVFHEAAMWRIPTIGSFNCGAEDAIADGHSGVLVDPYGHDKIAQVMFDIFTDKIKIDPEECKKWAADNDWDKKDLLQMYKF